MGGARDSAIEREERSGEDGRQKGKAVEGRKKKKKTELLSCCGTLKQSSEASVPSVMRNA